jgi:hypothetical protein
MKTGVSIAILITLTLCSIVPFAARAVYLDEHMFLHIAETVWQKDWRFPQDAPWVFFGIPFENLAIQTHPPLGEYFLAFMLKIFGRFEEIPFRLLWGIFPIMAVLGFYRLAIYFTDKPLLVSSLFAVSPAFFVMSPTLMMDIPLLSFFLLGLGFYVDCIRGNRARLWLASTCFILSAGMGYTILVPMGCLFLWAAAQKRPLEELLSIAAAPAVLLLWLLTMRSHFGLIPMVKVAHYFSTHSAFRSNLLPIFSFIGGVSFFPWTFYAFVDLRKKWIIASVSILAALILSFGQTWPSLAYRSWYVVLASGGIGFLIAFVLKSRRRSDDRPFGLGILILWPATALLFFLLTADMISARYILLSLPPLFLVTFAHVRARAAIAVFCATLLLSVSLAIGDYRYVNSYRDWVAQAIVPLQQQGFRIWSATESGLRFYLKKRGIETLHSSDVRPRGGDLVVKQASFTYGLSRELEPLLLSISTIELKDSCFVRAFDRAAGAGFHDSQVVPADYSGVPVWFPGGVMLKQVEPEMKFSLNIPPGTAVAYELEGKGTCTVSDRGITLKKTNAGPAIWKNFRLIPKSLQHLP